MKTPLIIVLGVLSSLLVFVGALMKIMHWPYSSMALIGGLALTVICVTAILIKEKKGKK